MRIFISSLQVMLFRDRLEVWNPGALPPTLTIEKLRGPHASVPHNPLLAEPMYLTKYIERMGTGIRDMIRRCKNAVLPEPEIRIDDGFWVLTIRRKKSGAETQSGAGRDQVGTNWGLSGDQVSILRKCLMISTIGDLMVIAERTNRTKFRDQVLKLLLEEGLLQMTIPDKPTSSKQHYQITERGRQLLEQLDKEGGPL